MDDIKVLMADDEKEILDVTAQKVSREGYTVTTAYDGEEAWEKIGKEAPDIILLDLMMPKMNGFDVLKKLRETPPSEKWQPVIIISSKGELEDMQKGFSLQADHYISKPCSVSDILKSIKTMINLIPHHKSKSDELKEQK